MQQNTIDLVSDERESNEENQSMTTNDLAKLFVRIFGLYNLYIFAAGVIRCMMIIFTASYPEGSSIAETTIQTMIQPLFSLSIGGALLHWSTAISAFISQPDSSKTISIFHKSGLITAFSLVGAILSINAFSDLIRDAYIYIDFTRISDHEVTVISAPTMAFGIRSTQNPIFAVVYDSANLCASIFLLTRAKKITAYVSK